MTLPGGKVRPESNAAAGTARKVMGAPVVTSFGTSMVAASGRASSSSLVKLRFSAPTSISTAGSAASATAGRNRKKPRIKARIFVPCR